jgi:hypothetical protein
MAKQVKMTKEIMDKLRGVSVISGTIECPIDIIDVPEEFKPVFIIKNLSVEDTKMIKESSKGKDMNSEEVNDILDNVCRTHIVGWRNLYDLSTGNTFDFKADESKGCELNTYNMLPQGIKVKILSFLYTCTGIFS